MSTGTQLSRPLRATPSQKRPWPALAGHPESSSPQKCLCHLLPWVGLCGLPCRESGMGSGWLFLRSLSSAVVPLRAFQSPGVGSCWPVLPLPVSPHALRVAVASFQQAHGHGGGHSLRDATGPRATAITQEPVAIAPMRTLPSHFLKR